MVNKLLTFIFAVTFCATFLISGVNAQDWFAFDNYEKIDKTIGDYGKIEVWDKGIFIIGEDTRLSESVLEFNSNQCITNCRADISITLYEEGELIQDLKFVNKEKEKKNLEFSAYYIKQVPFETQVVDWDKSREVCPIQELPLEKGENTTKNCYMDYTYKNVTEYNTAEIPYNIGDIVPAGTYDVVLKAKKQPQESIDWIITVKGVEHKAWAWWDTDWSYKKQLNFTEQEGDTRTNVTINFQVPYNANMNSDFSDLRFLDSTESTELYFWIQNYTTSGHANIWLKLDLTASSITETYMYYGNAGASEGSDITNAFKVGIDWTEQSSLPTGWNKTATQTVAFDSSHGLIVYGGSFLEAGVFYGNSVTPDSYPFAIAGFGNSRNGTGIGVVGFFSKAVTTSLICNGHISNDCANIQDRPDSNNFNAQGSAFGVSTLGKNTTAITYVHGQNDWGVVVTGQTGGISLNKTSSGMTAQIYPTVTGSHSTSGGSLKQSGFFNAVYVTPTQTYGDEQTQATAESPTVILNAPENEYNSSSYDVVFNCSANSTIGITNLSLYLNNNLNETITNTSGYQNLSFENTKTFENGYYNWSCLASNNDGSTMSEVRNFNVSVTYPAPTVVLNNPINWYNESSTNNIVFNCSANVTEGIKNLSLVINNVFNETITNSSAFQNLSLQKTINMNNSYYNWTCIGASDYVTTTGETRVLNVSVPITPYTPEWNSTFEIGLQAYYDMDYGTGNNFYDYMGVHNGSFVSNAEYTTIGKINNASYYYNGLANVTISPPTFNSTSPFSLQAWVNSTGNSGFIFATSNDTESDKGYNVLLDGSKIEVRIGDDLSNSLIVKTSDSINLNVWNHIIVIYDGSEKASNIQIWVNGVNKSYSVTTNSLSSKSMTIDKLYFGGRLGIGYFSGRLDEIAIWNKTLSVQEVEDLYNSNLGISPNQDTSGSIEVVLSSPLDTFSLAENTTLTLEANVSTNYANMTNASFYIWNSNQTVYNLSTFSLSGRGIINTTSNSYYSLPVGNYNWNVFACSINDTSATICDFSATNRSFVVKTFSEGTEYFENNVYETTNTNYEINVTIDSDSTLYSALLNYSGVNYEANVVDNGAGSYTINKNLDVPIVLSNTTASFNWILSVNLEGSFINQQTTINYQNITKTYFWNNVTNFAINYTIKNEDTDALVTANIYNLIDWYLGTGNSIQNNSFSLSPRSVFYMAKFPLYNNLTYNHQIELTNASITTETYYLRTFDFLDENWTKARNQVLYLLPTGNGTEFKLSLKDTGLKALPDYLIKVYRFYPETNTYKLVESRKTDYYGQVPVYVRQRDTKYMIKFYDSNGVLVKTAENVYFICESLVSCSNNFILQDDEDLLERFGNLSDYDYTFRYLNNTKSFEFVWNDNRDENSIHNLIVEMKLLNGTYVIYNVNSTNNPGILTYTISSNDRATYTATAIRYSQGKERVIGIISEKLNDLSKTFGYEGILWSLILLFTLVLIGIYHPPTAIILYTAGFILLGLFDIINIHIGIIIAQLAIGIAFIIAFRS